MQQSDESYGVPEDVSRKPYPMPLGWSATTIAAWLRDAGQMADPYVQRLNYEGIAEWFDNLPNLYASPLAAPNGGEGAVAWLVSWHRGPDRPRGCKSFTDEQEAREYFGWRNLPHYDARIEPLGVINTPSAQRSGEAELSESERLERGRKAWADVPDAAEWQREIRGAEHGNGEGLVTRLRFTAKDARFHGYEGNAALMEEAAALTVSGPPAIDAASGMGEKDERR